MTLVENTSGSETISERGKRTSAALNSVTESMRAKAGRTVGKAKADVSELAQDVQHRAEDLGETACETGSDLVAGLSEATMRSAETARDFARRNPNLLIAGVAVTGIGLAFWLRGGRVLPPVAATANCASALPARQGSKAAAAAPT